MYVEQRIEEAVMYSTCGSAASNKWLNLGSGGWSADDVDDELAQPHNPVGDSSPAAGRHNQGLCQLQFSWSRIRHGLEC